MDVIIMRGLPGSGKSSWIKNNLDLSKVAVCSADFYHMIDGVYKYDPIMARYTHSKCLLKFVDYLQDNVVRFKNLIETLVVDNTNTTAWQIAPYYQLAQALTCSVKILHIVCDFETAVKRNIHNVPASTIAAMQRSLLTEQIPSMWKEEFVFAKDFT